MALHGQGWRRTRRGGAGHGVAALVAFVVLLGLLLTVPVLAGGESERVPGVDDPPLPALFQAQRERDAQRQAELATPEAQAGREQSRTEFKGDDSLTAALDLAKREYGDVVTAPSLDGATLQREEHVLEWFRNNRFARIAVDGPGDGIVQSIIPLRTKNDAGTTAPVDLSLADEGDALATRNSVVDTEIPRQLSDGIGFESGIRLEPVEPRADSAPEQTVAGKVFHADIATDTDSLVAPTPAGAELFYQLRSEDSPEELPLRFDLQPGDELHASTQMPGAMEIRRSGDLVATLSPVSATDADGQPVEASYALRGDNELVIRVAHRGLDRRYPILVDPVFSDYLSWNSNQPSYDSSATFNGWHDYSGGCPNPQTCGTMLTAQVPSTAWPWGPYGQGLYVVGSANQPYAPGRFGEWIFQAPGDSYIYEAVYLARHTFVNSWAIEGIYDFTHWSWETAKACDFSRTTADSCPGSPYLLPQSSNGSLDYRWHCQRPNANPVTGCDPGTAASPAGTPGNGMVFQLTVPFGATAQQMTAGPAAYLGGAFIGLHEFNPPTITTFSRSNAFSGWVNDGSALDNVTSTSTDAGLGVKKVELVDQASGQVLDSSSSSCTGDYAHTTACPTSYTPPSDLSYKLDKLAEGVRTLVLRGHDVVGNVGAGASARTWEVKVDRSGPQLDVTGPLAEAADTETVVDDEFGVEVHASDGSAEAPRSGVKSITIKLDGIPAASTGDQSCVQGNCAFDLSWSLDPATIQAGPHAVQILTQDQSGNTATKTLDVTTDPSPSAEPDVPAGDVPAEDPDVQAAAVDAYTQEYSVSSQEAERRIGIQDGVAGHEQDIESALGSDFAGIWFDSEDGGKVKVAVAADDLSASEGVTATRQVLTDSGVAGDSEVVSVEDSYADLEAAQQALDARISELIGDGKASTSLDPPANAVAVEKTTGLSTEEETQLTSAVANTRSGLADGRAAASPAVAVEVSTTDAPLLNPEPLKCVLPYCQRPMRGGVFMLPGCTVGFIAKSRSDGKRYVLTAGHCLNTADRPELFGPWTSKSAPALTDTYYRIGLAHNADFFPNDAGIIRIEPGSYWTCCPRPGGYVAVDASSNTVYDTAYDISREGLSKDQLYRMVCVTGGIKFPGTNRFTKCGFVLKVDVTSPKTLQVKQGLLNICGAHGQSGGPIYKKHVAYGMVSNGFTLPDGRCRLYYQSAIRAENLKHVDIIHQH